MGVSWWVDWPLTPSYWTLIMNQLQALRPS
jgi:hypothetical protein